MNYFFNRKERKVVVVSTQVNPIHKTVYLIESTREINVLSHSDQFHSNELFCYFNHCRNYYFSIQFNCSE